MKKLDKHIKISEELHNKIIAITKETKNNYSKEICNMLEEAISNRVKQEQLNKIQNDNLYILKKVNLTYELIKQVYSDLNFTNITDPKKSYAVNEFLKRVKVSRLDD